MIADGSIKLNHISAVKPSCLRERKLGKCEKLTPKQCGLCENIAIKHPENVKKYAKTILIM